MKVRWSLKEMPALPAEPVLPRPIEDPQGEQRRVLKRLRDLIEMHQDLAERIGVLLGVVDIVAVIDALVAEAEGGDPHSALKHVDEVREYARLTMYDELLLEPSNVLLTTQVNADTVRYDSMPRAFWVDCLRTLRGEWNAKLGPSESEGISTAQRSKRTS